MHRQVRILTKNVDGVCLGQITTRALSAQIKRGVSQKCTGLNNKPKADHLKRRF